MEKELQRLRTELAQLGLSETLTSLDTEIKTKKFHRSCELHSQASEVDEQLTLPPLSVAQPVFCQPLQTQDEEEISKTGIPLATLSLENSEKNGVSEFLEFGAARVFSIGREPQDYEEDPGTPVCFSPQSWTSNASTIVMNPPSLPSPCGSPFAGNDSPSRNVVIEDLRKPEEVSEVPEFETCMSHESFARVNSLNEAQGSGVFSTLALEPIEVPPVNSRDLNFGAVSKDSSPFARCAMNPKEETEEGEETGQSISFYCPPANEENFSFPPTPPGSETGSGKALRQLSSLNSFSLPDLCSSQSLTDSSKPKSQTMGESSTRPSSGMNLATGSPVSTDLESPKEGETRLGEEMQRAKVHDSLKRVSMTLDQHALEWVNQTHEPIFPTLQEKPQSLVCMENKLAQMLMKNETKFSFPLYPFSQDYIDQTYDLLNLKIYHKRGKTGFESSKDLYVERGDVIAGRYQVIAIVGSAVFSKAIKALDLKENRQICLKMVKNVKDYFDQSLDEIKLLRFLNGMDAADERGIVQLLDFFYYREHLFLVFELLQMNLYEIQQKSLKLCGNNALSESYYFSLARIQNIARQLLKTLSFLHTNEIIHSDLKPENILMKDIGSGRVKVIDLGSSCFITDYLGSYVQSRSYRAPEVVLGVKYDQKVDLWSLGCILVELFTGQVLFQTSSIPELVYKIEKINGPIPEWMIKEGEFSHQFFSSTGRLSRSLSNEIENNSNSGDGGGFISYASGIFTGRKQPDVGFKNFISQLLTIDPRERLTAEQMSEHPWLMHPY